MIICYTYDRGRYLIILLDPSLLPLTGTNLNIMSRTAIQMQRIRVMLSCLTLHNENQRLGKIGAWRLDLAHVLW